MGLKNVNPNGGNAIASNVSSFDLFYFILFFENCENWVHKQISYVILFNKCHDCPKNKFLILLNLQIKIEWIEASLMDMDLFHKEKKKKINNFLEVFLLVYL